MSNNLKKENIPDIKKMLETLEEGLGSFFKELNQQSAQSENLGESSFPALDTVSMLRES